ncbi:MAG: single-strand DNA-binding protein [Thermosipho sp. (in: thermotogales)]|jgi:single-strand DNA-binding protein|nr:single-strand DNA-binding protein [Thermosipho sp. (in: thermotogales)]
MFAQAQIIGRLTHSPQLKMSSGGKSFLNFDLAVPKFKKNNEVSFFHCVAFGTNAENIAKYVEKGDTIFLNGNLEQENYKGRDGANKEKVTLIANRVVFMTKKTNSKSSKNQLTQDIKADEEIDLGEGLEDPFAGIDDINIE